MMLKLFGTLSIVWLVMAISVAQPTENSNSPVLDTAGQALESGVEYYILPDINQTGGSDNGGGLTFIDRYESCVFYVGQEDSVDSTGFPVIFTPFFAGETRILENSDFTVYFSAFTTCMTSTAWKVGERDPATNRRFIGTGTRDDQSFGSYFRIERDGDSYRLTWCPTDVCPTCRFICGSAGVLIDDGKRLLALDGPQLPVVFRRA